MKGILKSSFVYSDNSCFNRDHSEFGYIYRLEPNPRSTEGIIVFGDDMTAHNYLKARFWVDDEIVKMACK